MTMKKRIAASIVFGLGLFAFAPIILAQGTFTLNFGSLGMDTPELPAWFAKETGIFEKNALDVRIVYLVGGPTAVATDRKSVV